MLIQISWLLSLYFLSSAAAHAGLPMGFRPRDLATGTANSSSSPPYPTGTANGTATPTGSIAASTATSTPVLPSGFFYLVIASTGTPYDGQLLRRTGYKAYNGGVVLYPEVYQPDYYATDIQSHFSLLASGALYNAGAQGVAGIGAFVTYGTLVFAPEEDYEYQPPFPPGQKSICKIVSGAVTCQTGPATVFYICPFISAEGSGGDVLVGPSAEPGCTVIDLLAVPVPI